MENRRYTEDAARRGQYVNGWFVVTKVTFDYHTAAISVPDRETNMNKHLITRGKE